MVAAPSAAQTSSTDSRTVVVTSGNPSTACDGQIAEYFGDHVGAMTPGSITTGADGHLWFTDGGDTSTGGSRIGKMSTDGAVLAFYTPVSDPHVHATAITTGPDGNLWFVDTGEEGQPQPNLIGKMTLDGTLTEYSTGPDPTADPAQSIVTGADGNLWFPQTFIPGNPRIAKMTTDGVVTSYPIGLSDVNVGSVARGPDGNVWFNYWQNQPPGFPTGVAKVTPGGTVTIYPVSAPLQLLGSLTTGPDGNLWSATQPLQGLTHSLVKVTPSGVATVVPVSIDPHASIGPIITAPDGNLWFTVAFAGDGNENGIVRLSTDGITTEFREPPKPINQNSLGGGITIGPDGNIWFTEFFAVATLGVGPCPIRLAPTFTG
jgi:streptogramin lyase